MILLVYSTRFIDSSIRIMEQCDFGERDCAYVCSKDWKRNKMECSRFHERWNNVYKDWELKAPDFPSVPSSPPSFLPSFLPSILFWEALAFQNNWIESTKSSYMPLLPPSNSPYYAYLALVWGVCYNWWTNMNILFFFFVQLNLRYMEVPRLGVELELQLLAYTTATAMRGPNRIWDLRHNSQQCQIL